MLKSLHIKNYKLIHEARFLPSPDFTVITGETGAGKSTLMGAFGLLMGNRAEASIWKEKEDKCMVEGVFALKDKQLLPLFEEHELDWEPECLIRREISKSGKSRAFINDTPVTLEILKQVGEQLVDVHSQHETLSIGEAERQMETLDVFASSQDLLTHYQKTFEQWQEKQQTLKQLQKSQAKSKENLDYNTFLFSELEALPLDTTDDKDLAEELEILENASTIQQQVAELKARLESEEFGAIDQLNATENALQKLTNYGPRFGEVATQFASAFRELEDALASLDNLVDSIDGDPQRLDDLTELSDKLNSLFRKHHCTTIAQLAEKRENLRQEIQQATFADEDLAQLKKDLEVLEKEVKAKGEKLSLKRKKAAPKLAETLQARLQTLGIPKAQIEISFADMAPYALGVEETQILFSANAGVKPAAIATAASGGEYSRIMLAVKSILAGKVQLPTLFFDEIDSGVSGQVAIQVADVLRQLATDHQVISITHMPQVAAKGNTHYRIHKSHESGQSLTTLQDLDAKGKLEEIATMIGGDKKSEAAIASAKELIEG